MNRYARNFKTHMTDTGLLRRVVVIAIPVLLIATIALTALCIRASAYRAETNRQYAQRMTNYVSSAIDQVNRMSSSVTSSTGSRIALVRQYVYAMEQVNEISVALNGEGGRFLPAEAFTALYSDLTSFETLTQTATNSTIEARNLLLNHLYAAQHVIGVE